MIEINKVYNLRLLNKNDKYRYDRETYRGHFWFQIHLHYYFLDNIIISHFMYNRSHIYFLQDGYIIKGFCFPPNGLIKEIDVSREGKLNSYFLDKQGFIGFKGYIF